MSAVGLDGFEVMWVAGSMVLLSFPDVASRRSFLSQAVLSTWFGCLEEWSASVEYESRRAWISISGLPIHLWSEGSFCNIAGLWGNYLPVEQCEVVADAVLRDRSQEVSVVSPHSHSSGERDGVISPCWHANQLWGLDSAGKDCAASAELVGAIERVVCDRGSL
ncbi:hypothetical protein V6N11_076790 [Hibiscus sabdariffa]|uniref:DUF4283 domain-containing protein n=1 Tax=Hibiscus sabdariffa TaxID=183260 RepID=A0ABR2P9W1_9ROSI